MEVSNSVCKFFLFKPAVFHEIQVKHGFIQAPNRCAISVPEGNEVDDLCQGKSVIDSCTFMVFCKKSTEISCS